MKTAYINGEYFKTPSISPFDLGFLRGYGVFEHFRTYEKHPAFLSKRLHRLLKAATAIEIKLSHTLQEIEDIVYHLIEHNDFIESTIRIIVTKGITEDGLTPIRESSLIILTKPYSPFPANYYKNGIHALTTVHNRLFPEVKILNYLPAMTLLEGAREKGAQEVLYCNAQGEILEGTTCNFFAIKGDKLLTAKEGILPGITRDILLEKCANHFDIELRPLNLDELSEVDEAFTTSSIKEIVPLVAIDARPIGTGQPGPKTQQCRELFRNAFLELTLD
ncbi:MAG: D-alanine aminotransferase [Chlamydiae bacterium]|nr:D-alanine aminotransferase [Chlamydiota bacterium]